MHKDNKFNQSKCHYSLLDLLQYVPIILVSIILWIFLQILGQIWNYAMPMTVIDAGKKLILNISCYRPFDKIPTVL